MTVLLLSASKVFMTIACYGHLKHLNPALTLPQLKIRHEVITRAVFVPFALFFMG
jgi:uncharacterized protein (DUF486 family)